VNAVAGSCEMRAGNRTSVGVSQMGIPRMVVSVFHTSVVVPGCVLEMFPHKTLFFYFFPWNIQQVHQLLPLNQMIDHSAKDRK
jgi:hypothetical protein